MIIKVPLKKGKMIEFYHIIEFYLISWDLKKIKFKYFDLNKIVTNLLIS